MGLYQIKNSARHRNSQESEGRIYRRGEIFVNCIADKELISRIYQEFQEQSPSSYLIYK
jgi:hypothetical protein